MTTETTPVGAGESSPAPDGSELFRVHDALGNWMIEDVRMGRMICMTTRERDAKYICDALRAFDPPNAGRTFDAPKETP